MLDTVSLKLAKAYVWWCVDAPAYVGWWPLYFQLNPVSIFILSRAIEFIERNDAWH